MRESVWARTTQRAEDRRGEIVILRHADVLQGLEGLPSHVASAIANGMQEGRFAEPSPRFIGEERAKRSAALHSAQYSP